MKKHGDQSTESAAARRTDLDALRGVAMALGIVLHASLSFFPSPWPVQDREQSGWFFLVYAVIHSFRMPLFFLLSGFFTMFLLRRYGLRGMLRQRVLRILLPLALAMVTIVPVGNWLFREAALQTRVAPPPQDALIQAILRNDVTVAAAELRTRGRDWTDEQHGLSPLYWAALAGDPAMIELCLQAGADPDWRSNDGSTALHAAALFSHDAAVAALLDDGADPLARDNIGLTPLQKSIAWAKTAATTAEMLGLPEPDERAAAQRRAKCSELLERAAREAAPRTWADAIDGVALAYNQFLLSDRFGLAVGGRYFQVFTTRIFDHLWFLWMLMLLVTGFAMAVKLGLSPTGRGLWWIPAFTLVPQWLMSGIGPDLWMGLLPPPHMLLYYGSFFWFGAAVFARDGMATELGSRWKILLPLGLFVFLPAAFATLGDRIISTVVQAAAAWLITLGVIGIFRRYCSALGSRARWFSDSTYWLYLAHLPLVVAVQLLVAGWAAPVLPKFLLVNTVVVFLLLVSYQGFVRYTWLGTLLNGPRRRP